MRNMQIFPLKYWRHGKKFFHWRRTKRLNSSCDPLVLKLIWTCFLCLQVSNPSKMRVDVRFYADLISCGVLTPKEGLPLLGSFLTNLIHGDKEEHNSATIILAFCKFCGEDYAGLVSQKLLNDAERFKMTVPTSNWLPPDKRQNVRNLLREYYSSLCKHLIQVNYFICNLICWQIVLNSILL